MEARVRRSAALLTLFGTLVWLGLLTWTANTVNLRQSYSRLWREHDQMKSLLDQGQKDVRSAGGDSLSDVFEYMSIARGDYLNALEFVLVIGVFPVMVVWFAMALRAATKSNLGSDAEL